MTRARASFVRSAFTLLLGAFVLMATPVAMAGADNDAALVMDAESGRVLYARSGDAARAPASLTKMMTLYMLFDQIEAGRISLRDNLTATANAAAQKPTKLGLRKGDTLTVEQAIYSLVIVSANDAAVVVAEHLGGTEAQFARMMTQRARDLGMRRTTFRNASGLPDAGQITTARDMAILSRALMRNHPKLYNYFRATHFAWKKRTIKTHNRVLLSLNGANGIKTGYTRASGFNLATSAERNGKRLIGVVLGGDSWAQRDADMKTMLEAWFVQLQRRPNLVASYGSGSTVAAAVPVYEPKTEVASVDVPAAKESRRSLESVEAAPEPKKTAREAARELALAPIPVAKPKSARVELAKASRDETVVAEGDIDDEPTAKKARKGAKGDVLPLSTLLSDDSDDIAALIEAGYTKDGQPSAGRRSGDWGIQIGAFDSRQAAKDELSRARDASSKVLAKAADAITSVTNEKGRTFYRARFTEFTNSEAKSACEALKRDGFKCVTFSTATASAS